MLGPGSAFKSNSSTSNAGLSVYKKINGENLDARLGSSNWANQLVTSDVLIREHCVVL